MPDILPPAGIFLERGRHELLTMPCDFYAAVQAGTPMTVKGEETTLSFLGKARAASPFPLSLNILAEGKKSRSKGMP